MNIKQQLKKGHQRMSLADAFRSLGKSVYGMKNNRLKNLR